MMKQLSITLALFRREAFSLLVQPAAYFVVGLFVLIASFVFYLVPVAQRDASLTSIIDLTKMLAIFFVPLATMRLFAEEKRSGAIEILLTVPVTPSGVVAAKFAASWIFYLALLTPCAAYLGLFVLAGAKVDWGLATAGMLGLLLLGSAYLSAGLFISALTRSQIAAAAGTSALLLLVWFSWYLGGDALGGGSCWRFLSFKEHFDTSFSKGCIDTGDVVYYICLTAFFLFMTWMAVSEAAELGAPGSQQNKRSPLVTGIIGAMAVEFLLAGIAQCDIIQAGFGEASSLWRSGNWLPVLQLLLPFAVALALTVWVIWRIGPWRSGGNKLRTIFGAFAVAVILANVAVLAGRHAVRFDITERGLNSLDGRTRAALDSLQGPLVATVFITAQDEYEGYPLLTRTRELLQEYAAHSPRFQAIFIDPASEPVRAREMAEQYKLDVTRLPHIVLLSYMNKRALVPTEMILQKEPDSTGKMYPVFRGEASFTGAIMRLLDPRVPVAYISTGHGEFDAFTPGKGARALSDFAANLRAEGFEVRRLFFSKTQPVPADCDFLIMAGAFIPFAGEEVAMLREYLGKGGHALITTDPPIGSDPPDTGLEPVLQERGIVMRKDIVLDPKNSAGTDMSVVFAIGMPTHPVTAARQSLVCSMLQARSLDIRPSQAGSQGCSTRVVLASPKEAMSQVRDASGKSRPGRTGQLTLAASSEWSNGGKLLVVGDTDFMGNAGLSIHQNRAFAISAAYWLSGKSYVIPIAEREDGDRGFRLPGWQRRFLWWAALVALPQAWLLAGALVWWLRRQ